MKLYHGTPLQFDGNPIPQQDEEYWDEEAFGIFMTADESAAAFYATGDSSAEIGDGWHSGCRRYTAEVDTNGFIDLGDMHPYDCPEMIAEHQAAPGFILPSTADDLGIFADEYLVVDATRIHWISVETY